MTPNEQKHAALMSQLHLVRQKIQETHSYLNGLQAPNTVKSIDLALTRADRWIRHCEEMIKE